MKKTVLIVMAILIFTVSFFGCGKKTDSQSVSPAPTVNNLDYPSETPVVSDEVTEAVVSKTPVENTITPVITGGGTGENLPTGPSTSIAPAPTATPEVTQKPNEWKPIDERFIITPVPYAEWCPKGVGNIETPHGSGKFLNIPDYRIRKAEERAFAININSYSYDYDTKEYSYDYDEMYYKLSEIKDMEGKPEVVYYCSDVCLEVRSEDVLASYFSYFSSMYPENIINENIVRIPITIYTYEGCESFVLYHEYFSNYLMRSSKDRLYPTVKDEYFAMDNIFFAGTGKSYLNYKSGDAIKLVDYVYLGENNFGDVYKRLCFEAELDDYNIMPPEWFLDRGIAEYCTDAMPLALTVPYDYFMENFKWRLEGEGAYFYYVIKCSEEVEDPGSWAVELAELLESYGCGFSPRAFFKNYTE